MPRDVLVAVLSRLGAQLEGDRYRMKEDRDVTVFLGQPGRAAAVDHVLSVGLFDSHLEIEARERGTFYVAYDSVHALLDGRRKDRRTGSGAVGF